MRPALRRTTTGLAIGPGERVLATAEATDGVQLAGTRDAFYIGGSSVTRLPWERIETAAWDRDEEVFRVGLVAPWGEERVVHAIGLAEPGRLLELVRERVTASIVLQRHVPLRGRRGVRVIGRRPPRGNGEIEWFFEFDEGVDPAEPGVREASEAALVAARADVGL